VVAKKRAISVRGILARTEPAIQNADTPAEPALQRRAKTVTVALRQSEIERLTQIAQELNIKRNNLMAYALREFIRKYDAGEINPRKDVKTVTRL
jgi:hypothetical protein